MKLFFSCPNVKPEYECFPVLVESDEEQVEDDPYDPETERAPKRILLPVPQPVDKPPSDLVRAAPAPSRSIPSSSSKGPLPAEDELEEAIRESNRVVDNLEA